MSRGIYHRGYLPHWDFKGSVQAVTFRLADSVPLQVIKEWRRELESIVDDKQRQKEIRRSAAKYEDAGHGEACLGVPDAARIIQKKLIDGHPASYKLIAWCIMPNHVHVMIKLAPDAELAAIIQRWKGGSSYEINRILGRKGRLWQREYYDRYIRDMDHYYDCIAYIRNNPVKAGLCEQPEDWLYSCAGMSWNPNGAPASPGFDAPSNEQAD